MAFLSGVLLVAGDMFVRWSRDREENQSLERDYQDLAARLAALESHYPQALVRMDSRGLIRRVNGAAERLFGYDEAELLGHSILRLVPCAPSALNPAATRIAVADDSEAAEMEVLCKDRSPVRVRMTGARAESEERSDIYLFFEAAAAGQHAAGKRYARGTDDAGEQLSVEQPQSFGTAAGG